MLGTGALPTGPTEREKVTSASIRRIYPWIMDMAVIFYISLGRIVFGEYNSISYSLLCQYDKRNVLLYIFYS